MALQRVTKVSSDRRAAGKTETDLELLAVVEDLTSTVGVHSNFGVAQGKVGVEPCNHTQRGTFLEQTREEQ